MRVLLERNEVNPDKADKDSQTPLLRAAENGHEGIVRMLLKRNDVNPDKSDKRNKTPLSLAAQNEHEGIVKILQERKDLNSDRFTAGYRQIPLQPDVALLPERTDLIPKHAPSLQSSELSSPKPSELPEPPYKRARKF